MPTGQVFRWHFLIMVQPRTISGAVENPISSAPRRAPITMSRPKAEKSKHKQNIQPNIQHCTILLPQKPAKHLNIHVLLDIA